VCTDGALSFPEKCEEPGGELECQTSGYTPGNFNLPSQTCPSACTFSPAGYPGAASMLCTSCVYGSADSNDGIQSGELMAAGGCFPADAVWGTRCTSADRDLAQDDNPLTHPSAACWMCMTKAALDGHADPFVPCMNRMTQGAEERDRVAISAEQGVNRDAYCEDRVRTDALAEEGMTYELRCKDSGCCHWDSEDRPPKCRATESASMDECPLRSAIDLNAKASSAVVTVVRALFVVAALLVLV
jgi:hypothetical protein